MTSNSLTVIFRPVIPKSKYIVQINENSTVQDVLLNVCNQAHFAQSHNCFLWFNSKQLPVDEKLKDIGLYPPSLIGKDLPEVRLKFVQQLHESPHIGKHVVLASPEQIDYSELLELATFEQSQSTLLRQIYNEISSSVTSNFHSLNIIPLPIFSKQIISYLPTVYITLPDISNNFPWKKLLECLVTDLDINKGDIIIVNIKENPIEIEIKFTTKLLLKKKYVNEVQKKLTSNSLLKTREFIGKKLEIKFHNFNMQYNILEDNKAVTSNYIDLALRLSERPGRIESLMYDFLTRKSRQITTCLFNSFQHCSNEYVIDHIEIIYHENYPKVSHENQRVLFHATNIFNFENMFENFKFLSNNKQIDDSPYRRGYYFNSSPTEAIKQIKIIPRSILYLICAVVKVGQILKITNMNYRNKDIDENYNSHYIPLDENHNPVSIGQKSVSDEFVIKEPNQILPIYLIGLRPVHRFLIWRDTKITNTENSTIFERLRQYYDFNLYGCQSNIEVFDILNIKLNEDSMKCVVVTNGGDDGEQFVRHCRQLRKDIPIAVFCQNIDLHKTWATSIPGPKVKVTNKEEDLIICLDKAFGITSGKK